jgi:hypothetical protein
MKRSVLRETYAACMAGCERQAGLDLLRCEVGCLTQPTSADWQRADHLARHKYHLTGEQAFLFAYAWTLGKLEGKSE